VTDTEIIRARWFPGMPPMLPGEGTDAYTDRLTGADRTGRVPYDHQRNRQCSIGYHDECSDPAGESCQCPCHAPGGEMELRAWDLEESLVAAYGVITGRERRQDGHHLAIGLKDCIEEIVRRRPGLAEWYLRPEGEAHSG
jgi:hypothetical protein